MKKLAVSLLIAGSIFTFFWFKKTTQNRPLENTIIVGTSADFYPFSFRDQDDAIVGFDIDVVKEVARRLGMNVDLQDRPFAMLLPQIQVGQIHAIAAGMSSTPERAQIVNFTNPYLTGNPLLVVSLAKHPITSLENLKGKDVIVNTGYVADTYMSGLPDINLVRLATVEDAFLALEHGKAYAFVTSAWTAKPVLKKLDEDKAKFTTYKIEETDENSALGISKTLPQEFFDRVQKALDEMEADGTLATLKQKWDAL